MPAQQHTHRCRGWLACSSGSTAHLAEAAGRLGCHFARCTGRNALGVARGHTLVAALRSVISSEPSVEDSRDEHVLHQDVKALAASLRSIDALEKWTHLTGLDRLQYFNDCLQMRLL